ncbi:MAG TPA: GGDEF domain-containing protein, partial [Pseudomonas sp.]|nr:GGDEF domain-containing protein [Pseudomonas sp.]
MSQTEAQRWKEKYLQALERQEQLEERWEARLDLLRRSLVRSSFAVEGGDPAVERCMQQLRAVLREGDLDDGLSALVPRLESAVLNGERERHERVARLIGALQRLVEQLLALTPPNEVRKSLKRYARQAEKRAAQASELPALLGELAGLQAQTLAVQDSSEKRADGLLQRLFGHGQRTLAEQVAEAPVPQVAEPHAETTETVQVVCATTRRDDFDWSLLLDQLPMPAALFDEPEPAAPQEAEEQPAA